MPKRQDIRKILLIGSGPIVIGQACEFDYSGTQALKALREGLRLDTRIVEVEVPEAVAADWQPLTVHYRRGRHFTGWWRHDPLSTAGGRSPRLAPGRSASPAHSRRSNASEAILAIFVHGV